MKTVARNFLAVIVSILSFAFAVGVVVALDSLLSFNLFSLMWWGFIPVGAFAVGCLAASGYYLGAVKLNVKPTRFAAVSLFVLVALVQVALYYAQYAMTTTTDGHAVREFISFPRFVSWTLSHSRYGLIVNGYRPGGADGGWEMGWVGYAVALVQFLGLLAAGWVVYFVLSDKPYCEACSRYLKSTMKLQLPFAGDMNTVTELRKLDAPSQVYFDAIDQLPAGGEAGLELELSTCPQCSREALQERPMLAKAGKLEYQGDAYRTLWSAGDSCAPHLVRLQSAMVSAQPAAPPTA